MSAWGVYYSYLLYCVIVTVGSISTIISVFIVIRAISDILIIVFSISIVRLLLIAITPKP